MEDSKEPLSPNSEEKEKEKAPQQKFPPQLSQQASRVSRASGGRYGTGGRSGTLRSQLSTRSAKQASGKPWERVVKAVKSGALVAVGLQQTEEEKLHWNAVQSSIYVTRARGKHGESPSPSMTFGHPAGVQRAHSNISYREVPAAHISAYPYRQQPSSISSVSQVATPTSTQEMGRAEGGVATDGPQSPQPRSRFVSEPSFTAGSSGPPTLQRQRSLYSTGRVQVVRTELKPDLWKLAYKGVKRLASQSGKVEPAEVVPKEPAKPTTKVIHGKPKDQPLRSFVDLGEDTDEEEGEEEEGMDGAEERWEETRGFSLRDIQEEDENFFGADMFSSAAAVSPGRDEMDAAIYRFPPPTIEAERRPHKLPRPTIKQAKRRGRIGLPNIIYDPLFGGYDRGYGGLGLPSHLLRFKYKEVPGTVQRRLDAELLHKRPYFTYWLMLVHFIILVTALAVYGFAPYGWDQEVERDIVYGSQLSYTVEERIVIPNVWLGPSQQSLVLLGALYGPCMRRDRQLFDAIEDDRTNEQQNSGCCVQHDGSGCVQLIESGNSTCSSNFAEFVSLENGVRGVCGTSPQTCIDPQPERDSSSWVPNDILTWPICLEDTNENSTESHLTCEITGRPCCVGIQAHCRITTREHCDYLEGIFHQEAFLCSQVDCLNTTCGLLPFREFNQPDQVYRLWLALFMHAGLLHLLLSLIFSFLILRHVEKRLGWLRTAILYILSGVGGNLVSVFFVPYNPEVGPAGSILGIVAYMFVFLIFESRLLVRPWLEFLKLGVVVLFLFLLGLFPFIDNFAHIGGFVFGLLLSGVLIPYHSLEYVNRTSNHRTKKKRDWFRILKWVMVLAGVPILILLFVVFFILFYIVQDTWDGFRYLNCLPFTATICQDLGGNIRTRDTHII